MTRRPPAASRRSRSRLPIPTSRSTTPAAPAPSPSRAAAADRPEGGGFLRRSLRTGQGALLLAAVWNVFDLAVHVAVDLIEAPRIAGNAGALVAVAAGHGAGAPAPGSGAGVRRGW